MSAIIEGYNYDIFISYRQKDNKGDHWVSEFVEALKTEIESTFKEEISVYFDINPHDGLLETHDVDASLKEKLKCLIFIPIISRTYCDPKSFAWEHEFKAFVELASKDQFGLKGKLPNGNVASRVLPIRIHDLDSEDIKECESVLGAILRGLEFIYREPGVNKPLPKTDPKYSILINKAANSIKEIIRGLRNETEDLRKTINHPDVKKTQANEKSIIVLPFDNISSDPEQEYFSDGLTEEIITDLAHIKDLLVISRSSAMTFKKSNKTIPEIAAAVSVRFVLEGSVRRAGNKLRITAQLIDASNDTHVWAEKYDGVIDDIFDIQENVSMAIVSQLKIRLTSEEESKVKQKTFKHIDAYDLYLRARKFIYSFEIDRALDSLNNALEIEGPNSHIYAQLAHAHYQFWNFGIRIDEKDLIIAREYIQKSFELDIESADALFVSAMLEVTGGNALKAIKILEQALLITPNHSDSLGWITLVTCMSSARSQTDLMLKRLSRIDPYFPLIRCIPIFLHIYRGEFEKSKELAVNSTGGDFNLFMCGYALLFSRELEKSAELVNKVSAEFKQSYIMRICFLFLMILKKQPYDLDELKDEKFFLWARNDFQYSQIMSEIYSLIGNTDNALDWLENAFQRGFVNYPFLDHIDPFLENIRHEDRFKKLMKKVKFEYERVC